MITIREIAELAGTSRGTVDRVLKGRGGVKRETRELIEQICRERSYVPNRAGVMLGLSKKGFKVGVVLPSLHSKSYEQAVRGMEEAEREFSDFGISLELYELGRDASEELAAVNRLAESGMQALIISPLPSKQLEDRIAELSGQITVVTLGEDYGLPCASNVRCNPERSGRAAAELCGLFPKTEGGFGVGVVGGSSADPANSERLLAFLDGIKQFKDVSVRRIVESEADGAQNVSKIRKMYKNYPDIRILFCAAEAVPAALEAGNGAEIVAFETDDFVEDALKTGKLRIAFSEQGDRQGYLAVKLLADDINGRPVPRRVEVPVVAKTRYGF